MFTRKETANALRLARNARTAWLYMIILSITLILLLITYTQFNLINPTYIIILGFSTIVLFFVSIFAQDEATFRIAYITHTYDVRNVT